MRTRCIGLGVEQHRTERYRRAYLAAQHELYILSAALKRSDLLRWSLLWTCSCKGRGIGHQLRIDHSLGSSAVVLNREISVALAQRSRSTPRVAHRCLVAAAEGTAVGRLAG